MKKTGTSLKILMLLASFAVLTAACAPAINRTPTQEPGSQLDGVEELVQALKNTDSEVEMLGQINQPFFSVSGRIIRVDGAEIQVFDYPSTGARANDSILITPTGRQIGETIPTWIGQPNFWAKDQLIVLYVGDKRDTIDLLTQVLGQPITVHTQTPAPAPPQAAVEARALLSERLNVPEEQIDLVSAERVEWPSSCLGLVEGPDPICVERVIPGWNLMFRVNGQVVEVHTDQRGDNIRIKEDTLP